VDAVVLSLDQDEHTEGDRDEESDGVDDPVARRSGTSSVQQRRIELCRQRDRHQLLGPDHPWPDMPRV